MAGGGLAEVRDLAADPNLTHFALKQQTHRLIEAAYGKKLRGIERVTCEQDQTLNQQVIQSIVTRSEGMASIICKKG
ncbi:hypothetical protein [Klebsiella pneumoniae IS39]|nr:hypothetical protein [Klebsiella pneumoniae IS39]